MKLEFYPLDFALRNDNEILIVGKTAEGNKILLTDNSSFPYFYVSGKITSSEIMNMDFNGIRVLRANVEKKNLIKESADFIKVELRSHKHLKQVKNALTDLGIKCYEYDISFVRKYVIEKKIIPLTLYECEAEILNERARVPVYKILNINQTSTELISNPKILAFDIETYGADMSPSKNPILMISFYSKGFKKVITWKEFETKQDFIEFVESEAKLIERFKEILEELQPDFLVGYSSDNFDLPYIKERANINNIKLNIGIDYSELKVKRAAATSCKIKGIQHIDLFKFIRNYVSRTMQIESYDLNSVAKELLGEEKSDIKIENLTEAWDKNSNLEEYSIYNLRDSELVFMIFNSLLQNILELVKLVGLTPFEITRMSYSQIVEAYLMRRAPDFNQVIPNKPNSEEIFIRKRKSYKGAFVFKPEPGIYSNIVIFDFRSLYPSIISSHNISPDTLNCDCCIENKVPETGYWFCRHRKGFISSVIEEIIKRRITINELIKTSLKEIKQDNTENNKNEEFLKKEISIRILKARSQVLKTIANSMYGYLGFFMARWYCLECAESITAYGRHYIQSVIKAAEKNDFKVIYSDTDSIFISLGSKTMEEAELFASKVNLELPKLMELEFQGFYPKGIFVSAKLSQYGAKKKYALLDEKNNLKVIGFEIVRRNWSSIGKEVQSKVLEMILRDNDVQKAASYVKSVIEDLRKKKIKNEMLVIHTQIQKRAADYASIGPHVAIAKKMKEKGKVVKPGSIISYIVVSGEGKISSRVVIPEECPEGSYDSNYYIKNQVIPSVEKIFEVLGYNADEFLEEKSQSKLGSFLK
ncbi:MAG: DNA-directed DNA polymerase [Candidatus Woesearchaeota archaeon]